MVIQDLKTCPQNLDMLAQWHHHEWASLNPGQTLQQRISNMQLYLNNDFIPSTFVALDTCQKNHQHNRPLGSAAIVDSDMTTRSNLSPWLASVYVEENNRKKGIGSQLVEYVMLQAKNNSIRSLYLFTPNNSHFYQRLGWSIIEKTNYHNSDVCIMRIHL